MVSFTTDVVTHTFHAEFSEEEVKAILLDHIRKNDPKAKLVKHGSDEKFDVTFHIGHDILRNVTVECKVIK